MMELNFVMSVLNFLETISVFNCQMMVPVLSLTMLSFMLFSWFALVGSSKGGTKSG